MCIRDRWKSALTPLQAQRCVDEATTGLEADAAIWLEHGSLAVGARPNEIGHPPPTHLDTGRPHPVFGRLAKQQVNSLAAIAERRVADAREQGLFDDLALHGKPIPDIDRHRQPGWWANQFVARQRSKVRSLELEDEIRSARPAMWRHEHQGDVEADVAKLNQLIADYNRSTTLAPMPYLDVDEAITTWQRMKNR